MSGTQFAMVEELAFLVKDNLPCKHLVLSMEEAFINFLQDDTSSDGILELEPMNSYNRLLLHRLADIFGFAHESVGQGENRHLILERCPETSIPSILVADILWQCDEPHSPTTSHQLLRRDEGAPVPKIKLCSLEHALEEREAAYLAARERIFSVDVGEIKETVEYKPRHVPVVARRMIAHALGQKIDTRAQDATARDGRECEGPTDESNSKDKNKLVSDAKGSTFQESTILRVQNKNSSSKMKGDTDNCGVQSLGEKNVCLDSVQKSSCSVGASPNGSRRRVNKKPLKEEHLGAAKRMFAHALGLHSVKDAAVSKCNGNKQICTE